MTQLHLFECVQLGASKKTKVCTKCNQEKPVEAFRLYRRATGDRNSRDSKCKECSKYQFDVANKLRETAPSYEGRCWCCNKECDKPVLDHCHETEEFRGWLCSPCNLGIGVLGDDIEGVGNALTYLRMHYSNAQHLR